MSDIPSCVVCSAFECMRRALESVKNRSLTCFLWREPGSPELWWTRDATHNDAQHEIRIVWIKTLHTGRDTSSQQKRGKTNQHVLTGHSEGFGSRQAELSKRYRGRFQKYFRMSEGPFEALLQMLAEVGEHFYTVANKKMYYTLHSEPYRG